MTLDELFAELNVDGNKVISRFAGSQALVLKFVKKFLDDGTYGKLCDAVQGNDLAGIETAAHTLKGVGANLGFDNLSAAAAAMVDAVRKGNHGELPELFKKVEEEYNKTKSGIEKLD